MSVDGPILFTPGQKRGRHNYEEELVCSKRKRFEGPPSSISNNTHKRPRTNEDSSEPTLGGTIDLLNTPDILQFLDSKDVFSRAEVQRLLQVVAERASQWSSRQLQEQFAVFSNFNSDYVSRIAKERDFSYLS